MTYVLAALGILVAAGLIVLLVKWRRSRRHIGVARPADTIGVNDNPEAAMTPASTNYKQVIAPGADPAAIDQPTPQQIEDALATRPGAPGPGQTFSPTPPPDQTQKPPEPPLDPSSQS